MLSNLLEKFKECDIFGQPVTIMIDKRKFHKTTIGACASLIIFIIVIYSLVTSIEVAIDGLEPKITTYKQSLPSEEFYTFDKGSFYLGIQLISPYGKVIENAQNYTLFTIDFSICSSSSTLLNCTQVQAVPCEDSLNDVVDMSGIDKTKSEGAYCMPDSFRQNLSLTLQGQVINTNFSYIQFSVRKCVNSTNNNYVCAPDEAINTALYFSYVIYSYNRFELDASRKGDPFLEMSQYSQFRIQPSVKVTAYTYYTKVESKTVKDFWLVSSNTEKYDGVEFYQDKSEQMPLDQNDITVLSSFLLLGNNKIQYIRNYDNIFDVLGKVGGLFSILTTILSVIIKQYQWIDLKSLIVNKLNDSQKSTQQSDMTLSVVHYFKRSTRQKYITTLRDIEQQIDIVEMLKKLKNIDYLKKNLEELMNQNKQRSNYLDKSQIVLAKSQIVDGRSQMGLLGDEGKFEFLYFLDSVQLNSNNNNSVIPAEPSAYNPIFSPQNTGQRHLKQHQQLQQS